MPKSESYLQGATLAQLFVKHAAANPDRLCLLVMREGRLAVCSDEQFEARVPAVRSGLVEGLPLIDLDTQMSAKQ